MMIIWNTSLLTIALFLVSVGANAASFDCAKASSKAEKLICSIPVLSQADDALYFDYLRAKVVTGNNDDFKKLVKQNWKLREKNCDTEKCLLDWYKKSTDLYRLISANQPQSKNEGRKVYPYEENEAEKQFSGDPDSSEVASKVHCSDYRGGMYEGFAFPPSFSGNRYSIDNVVCYEGRDITSWVAGEGMKVTSALIPNPKESLAIVTIEEKNPQSPKPKSSVRIIYITQNGFRGKEDIIRQRYTEDPQTTLSNMKIVGYNHEKGIVYFSVPAWAVSHAIHAFTIPFDNQYMNIKEKFITDGDLTFVNMSNLVGKPENNKYIGSLVVEQSEIREGEGRVYNEYLISSAGKRICELDTDVEYWRLYLPCKK
ncbi:lysozyme inhibitor LprI family protein [Xenorhabdus bovienii]|uniref:lysozyme inhibitor LprI family protein n=1 Tax=Xenorhabdus bovienii TaxID=40576 RepID=UPI0023B0E8BD|nr:hypothetical protein [Xenorhabdus bovienii]MDE9477020.1 hypothetical protein [Xenorhabdus bovienii]MDE9530000.1 hypothetical protein [Xenorhabdus bovienii]MDE9588252.1 hypothetical protein [Xenorhabdus bovienii]